MSDETEVVREEGAGSATPPSPTPAAGEVAAPPAAVEEKVAGVVPPAPPAPSPPSGEWPKSARDRVAKLTARLREYEARGAGAQRPVDPGTGQQYTQEQIDAMINERAGLVAAQTSFNTRCNEAASRGAERFPDWQSRLNSLTQLVDQTDARSLQNYNLFLEAALETGDAEAIIHRLGSDLNEAARVLALSPVKMAMEVGKIGEQLNGKREPSKAPKPIRPIGSASPVTAAKPDDPERGHEMPLSDWMKARNAQAVERKIR